MVYCGLTTIIFLSERKQIKEMQKMNYLRAFVLISYNVLFTRGRLFVNPRQLSKRTLQVKFLFLIPVQVCYFTVKNNSYYYWMLKGLPTAVLRPSVNTRSYQIQE